MLRRVQRLELKLWTLLRRSLDHQPTAIFCSEHCPLGAGEWSRLSEVVRAHARPLQRTNGIAIALPADPVIAKTRKRCRRLASTCLLQSVYPAFETETLGGGVVS